MNMHTEPTISIQLPDGTSTPAVPMSLMKEAVAQIKKSRGKAPVKETSADKSVADQVYNAAGEELRQIIERYEQLAAEKAEIADQQKEVMAEAKGRGFNTKVIRMIIGLRKRDKDDIAEEEAVLEMYRTALGMG